MHECDVIWETRRVTQLDVKYTRSTSMRAAQSRCHTLASSVAKPVKPGLSAAFRRTLSADSLDALGDLRQPHRPHEMNRSTRRGAASAKRPRKGSARENWDRAEADQSRREKAGDGACGAAKVRRTSSGSGRARTPPAARNRAASATREVDAAEQPRIPTSRVTRRGTAAEAGGDGEAGDADDEADHEADDASEGSDTHGERRVESLQRAATMRGGGEVASLVLVKWCSLPQVCAPDPDPAP